VVHAKLCNLCKEAGQLYIMSGGDCHAVYVRPRLLEDAIALTTYQN